MHKFHCKTWALFAIYFRRLPLSAKLKNKNYQNIKKDCPTPFTSWKSKVS